MVLTRGISGARGEIRGVVASAGRWLVVALLLGMASAFAQQVGVYGGGSIEQGSSRLPTAYVPLVDLAKGFMG